MQQSSHVPSSVVQAESQWEKASKNCLLPIFVGTFGAKQWLCLYSHCPPEVEQVIIIGFAAHVKKDCPSFSLGRSVAAAAALANVMCECLYEYTHFPSSQGGRSVKQHCKEHPCVEWIWQAGKACPPACSCLSGLQAYGGLAKMQQYMCLGVKCK